MRAIVALILASMHMNEPPPDFDKLWDFNDPAATEQTFRALLPRAAGSGDESYRAQLLTQIARAQGLQRKFDEAHGELTPALKVKRLRVEELWAPEIESMYPDDVSPREVRTLL